jgi:hypothetical protein
MKKVLSIDGSEISGLFRSDDGSLIVNDPISYKKAITEKNRENEFDLLKEKVNRMESLLIDIYNKISKE